MRPPVQRPEVKQPVERKRSTGTDYLLSTIKDLPPSPFKAAYEEYVASLFEDPNPHTIDLAGVNIPVHGSAVTLTPNTKADTVTTSVMMRSAQFPPDTAYRPLKFERGVKVPYLLADSEDRRNAPQENKTTGGMVLINVEYATDGDIYEGISPEILVAYPSNPPADETVKARREFYTKFGLLKAVGVIAVDQFMREDAIKKMKALGYPTHLQAVSKGGTRKEIEVVSHSFDIFRKNNGRTLAIPYIAGHYLAMNALRDTLPHHLLQPLETDLVREFDVNPIIGVTSNEVLLQTIQWALATPLESSIPHAGDRRGRP